MRLCKLKSNYPAFAKDKRFLHWLPIKKTIKISSRIPEISKHKVFVAILTMNESSGFIIIRVLPVSYFVCVVHSSKIDTHQLISIVLGDFIP
uniref:Uncharacterized protein n=1 Tax=Heterorhabditis bacteriophora TaxID=37862 RepID=A0A1I7X5F2_HETBA